MPPTRLRLGGDAAFLVLVALGLWLAQLDPLVIGVALVIALVLVALLHRAASGAEAREAEADETTAAQTEPAGSQPVVVATGANEPVPEPAALPEPTVSERSARAILASAHPPPPPEPGRPTHTYARRVQRAPTPTPEPKASR
jgi:hypothetical protein